MMIYKSSFVDELFIYYGYYVPNKKYFRVHKLADLSIKIYIRFKGD